MSVHVTSLIWRARLGNAVRKGIAMKLGDCANDGGGSCYPSIERIAREAEVSPRTVQRSMREFERVGLLVLVREGGGRGNTNSYRFDMGLLKRLAEGELVLVGTGLSAALVPPSEAGAAEAVDDAGNGDTVSPIADDENGDSLSPFPAERVTATTGNPARVSPEPSRIHQSTSLSHSESVAAPATEREQDQGKTCEQAGEDPGDGLSGERKALIEALRADAIRPDIVEHFIRPMLLRLGVPPGQHGITYLRDLRDAAAKAGDVTPAALEHAAKAFRTDRVRDLPWPKDVAAALEAARLALMLTLQPGDPRWAAWLAHDRADPKKAAYAAHVERSRTVYLAPGDWPGGSAAVTGGDLGMWSIPAGTPEHAAWLAAWRREGRAGIDKAQAAAVSGRTLQEKSRWPVLGGGA